MRMRTIAPSIIGIIVAANFAVGQSLAELAEKEKERRKSNDQEATIVVKEQGSMAGPGDLLPKNCDKSKAEVS